MKTLGLILLLTGSAAAANIEIELVKQNVSRLVDRDFGIVCYSVTGFGTFQPNMACAPIPPEKEKKDEPEKQKK